MALTPSAEFEQLLTTFERNSNTGSLKAANGTLVKILHLMWAHIMTNEQKEVFASMTANLARSNEQADEMMATIREIANGPSNDSIVGEMGVTESPAEPPVAETTTEPPVAEAPVEPAKEEAAVPPVDATEADTAGEDAAKPKRGVRPSKG